MNTETVPTPRTRFSLHFWVFSFIASVDDLKGLWNIEYLFYIYDLRYYIISVKATYIG